MKMPEETVIPQLPALEIKIVNILGEGPCSRGLNIGDTFQYPEDREKICPAALSVFRTYLMILAYSGSNIYDPEAPNTFSVSCPDAVHPVVYKITRHDK